MRNFLPLPAHLRIIVVRQTKNSVLAESRRAMAKVGARDDVCKYENGGKSGYSVQIKE